MDNDSTDRLKFDRRLAARRGWIAPAELEGELATLPDAVDKIHVPSDEPTATGSETSEGAAPPAPAPEDGTPGA